jgi:HAE1 family hydrophobic/amphiphilic exporter-1/multidrug efflux pump
MSISTPFIRRAVATSLLMAAFVLVGIAAYPLLPSLRCRVDFTISVAPSPGRQPRDDGGTVAQPLECQFAQIAGVSQLVGQRAGSTQVTIQFDHRSEYRCRRRRCAGGDQ